MTSRRNFLKRSSLGLGTLVLGASLPRFALADAATDKAATTDAATDKADLKLAVQTWSFRLFDLDEAVQKTRQAGIHYIEIAGGTRIKGENKRTSAMTADERKWLQTVLADNDVTAISLGGCQGTPQEFDFAAEMGLTTLQGEPPFDTLVELSRRAEEYKVRFVLHNHPSPSRYWNYKEVLTKLDGCGEWLGFCPDTGHQMRSGIDPLIAVRELKGRIYSVHLKDLNDYGFVNSTDRSHLHDVPWGTGKGRVEAILRELIAQKVQGPVIVEYEHHWENNVAEIAECAKFFNAVVGNK
ncbi:MAG: sugar phosphate isomerase/epimerase [Planctomycetaceae bacterium]|nr:sugar phosphate isomerase/epimerase [Planctomycetaceae bacterium]